MQLAEGTRCSAAAERNLRAFAKAVRSGTVSPHSGDLHLGVDLGTANIVLGAVDSSGQTVAGAWRHSAVVRDGIVVDWLGAVNAVSELKSELQAALAYPFKSATVAVPPGMDPGTIKVFTNVLEAAGLETSEVVDEPVAAARALGITDGCVIDIGHGTTGVSVLEDGEVVHSMDEATGGHHMTLTLAGALGITYDQAERLKTGKKDPDLVFGIIRPVLIKMATIAAKGVAGYEPPAIYLVGGSSSFARAASVFEDVLRRPVTRSIEPLFVTPLGTAMEHSLTLSFAEQGRNYD